jgi:putative oxygen-independent coproporphyrinogen III oxidase
VGVGAIACCPPWLPSHLAERRLRWRWAFRLETSGDRLFTERCCMILDHFSVLPSASRPFAAAPPPTAAYIHIPFCRRRCYYCDFAVSIVGDRPPLSQSGQQTYGAIAEYVDVLCQEIRHTPNLGQPLQTVFFGGGTPSLLTLPQLDRILTTLDQHLGIAADGERSIEVDPDAVDANKIAGYAAAGLNRVSLGAQAFQLDVLQACGRTHTPDDIRRTVAQLRQAGIHNVSLDLISGLPHQTAAQWQASLEQAIALAPTHLSIYDLTIEPETAFGRWYQPGEMPLPSDDETAQFYRQAQQQLRAAGFQHYEISNYGRSGYECRHNLVYWRNASYYGFGMGAASYTNRQRYVRPRTRSAYFAWVEAMIQKGYHLEVPLDTLHDVFLDTVMVGLRLAAGLDVGAIAHQFGATYAQRLLEILRPYQAQGWVWMAELPRDEHRIGLSDPEGFLFSNVMLSTIFQQFGEAAS